MKCVGLAGWSGSGKTRLVCALIENISARGLRVSTIKHAHHSFDVDQEGKDSYLHRNAGAHEVLIASDKRWALMHERNNNEPLPSPLKLTKRMQKVDVLLVEGFKKFPIDKLEIYRKAAENHPNDPSIAHIQKTLLADDDPRIRAIISDIPLTTQIDRVKSLPVFDADDITKIADFILNKHFFSTPTKDIFESKLD